MSITAIVLSAQPYTPTFVGIEVLTHRSIIRNSAELQAARYAAVARVRTSHFFFLDDDDELLADHVATLDQCLAADQALAYTDELIRYVDGTEKTTARQAYSQAAHRADPMLVHHLALCRTADALEAIKRVPRGHFCPELLLYWELAKAGAAYVPAVGYVWNKGHGMHTWPLTAISQVRSALWCKEHP